MQLHDAAVEMKRRDFLAGNWSPYLQRALALSPHYDEPTNGAEVVAGLLEHTAREFKAGNLPPTSPGGLTRQTSAGINAPGALNRPLSAGSSGGGSGGGPLHAGQSRLRDTIAWGYVMGRHASRQAVDVPDWYTRGLLPAEALDPTPATASDGGTEDLAGQFSILEGPPALEQSFPDTLRFLKELGDLESMGQRGGEGGQEAVLPEHRAAAGLFDWSEEVYVSRAPGRLDVMGGIADYSGATVLQMPIAEAAHVALQLQAPERQRLWRHQAARVAARGPGAQGASVPPALRIVSLNADATNRGPAFDMDLSELLTPEGHPISYAAAQEYFKRDPALAWAAYAAGALVVLMHECGVRPHNGIAMLVSSAVPEGKGVSSSAAVEVASMSALAAAHGVRSEGRQLALLCQKVENLIVGAPCGVMDQMASALGEAGWLLGLRCQPAEVEGAVHIPEHLRFWGVDSGIRHSVGGSDYGAVRTGAFMGLKIVSSLAGGSSGVGEKEEVRLIGEIKSTYATRGIFHPQVISPRISPRKALISHCMTVF